MHVLSYMCFSSPRLCDPQALAVISRGRFGHPIRGKHKRDMAITCRTSQSCWPYTFATGQASPELVSRGSCPHPLGPRRRTPRFATLVCGTAATTTLAPPPDPPVRAKPDACATRPKPFRSDSGHPSSEGSGPTPTCACGTPGAAKGTLHCRARRWP